MAGLFSPKSWDGLAKIASLTINDRTILTPALFPVVDPLQQSIPIQEFKDRFGFDQVITSAYLMGKRIGHTDYQNFPKVHEYLEFDGMIMMDSGAYQVMLYGDIDLGVEQTLDLQTLVQTDIGVIMDHPIGYDVSHTEAKKRNETTIENLITSLPKLQTSMTTWTLPIQGGKYIDLLEEYLVKITSMDLLDSFSMFAIGSVVPVMINQDYSTLVKMIATSRLYLPADKPLHLFGAGHPAMFALATFLGCDTFDSAAYALMAKDDRYMTVDGTYHLNDLVELPCSCNICLGMEAKEFRQLAKNERSKKLSEHNLAVSSSEISRIRTAIRENRLWDLVLQRANSVPHLAAATREAMAIVTKGPLKDKFSHGHPISTTTAPRISFSMDINKTFISRIIEFSQTYLYNLSPNALIIIWADLRESLYNKFPSDQIPQTREDNLEITFLLPIFPTLIPFGLNEAYPLGQIIQELDENSYSKNLTSVLAQLRTFPSLNRIELIVPSGWQSSYGKEVKQFRNDLPMLNIIETDKPMRELIQQFHD